MDKTEMMKKYEKETSEKPRKKVLVMYSTKKYGWGRERNSFFFTNKFVEWLLSQLDKYQAKAAAYDRLMSGGKKTLKEWANFLGKCFAVDPDGFGYSFGSKPIIKDEHWWPDGDRIAYSAIRPDLIDYTGDWKDSLTLPDGWED